MKNMPPEQRAMMEKMMKGKMPQAAAAAPKTVYTAKGSGSVNGFSCTKYEGDQSGVKEAEVCAAVPAQIKLTPADLQIFEKDERVFQRSSELAGQLPGAYQCSHRLWVGIGLRRIPDRENGFRKTARRPSARN